MSLIPFSDDMFVNPFDYVLPRSLVPFDRNNFWHSLALPTIHRNRYNVNLDFCHFDPSEISVKVEDKLVKVSGKREKKSTDGKHYEYHHYEQHFTVPAKVNLQELKSKLDSQGILCIEAPVKGQQNSDKAHHIPIEIVKK